ncbi:MAG: hypothetical protein DCC59_02975 [Chloroflexi bacterium]|nr:hypothetical protein [Anaerolineales bacterium]MCQ3953086.1 hypothetical protein [Chloroflexota bacterium]RIK54786.1 MAG: hypothetical protein DCC59_02975 [Chloroflexota bacterium]
MKKKLAIVMGCLILSLACNLPGYTPTDELPLTQTPPPPPATAAPLPASPTPEPPPPYFDDEFDSASPYWKIVQVGGAQPATFTFDSSLRIENPAPDSWIVGVHLIHSYSNVFLRAKTAVNPAGSVGLICRYNETDGWYEFNIASDGTYSLLLGKWLAEGIVTYVPIFSDTSALAESPVLEPGLFCEDNFLRLYVNDALLRNVDVTNYGLTEGNIGISAASLAQAPATVLFEWISIKDK